MGIVGEAGEKGVREFHACGAQHRLLGGVAPQKRNAGLLQVAAVLLLGLDYDETHLALLQHLDHRPPHPAVATHHDVIVQLLEHRQVPPDPDDLTQIGTQHQAAELRGDQQD